jgi:hypothetical protein
LGLGDKWRTKETEDEGDGKPEGAARHGDFRTPIWPLSSWWAIPRAGCLFQGLYAFLVHDDFLLQ